MNKICTKCGVEKPLSEFYKKAGKKYGVDYRCKECFLAFYKGKRKKAREKREKLEKEIEKEILLKKKKICTKCGAEKSFTEFFKNMNKKFGIDSWCKECSKIGQEKRAKTYREKHPEKIALRKKRRRVRNEYGISLDEYEQRIHGTCDICGSTEGQMNLDHCHTTNKLRGCLCSSCNNGLGRFKDNPKFLTNALMYLNRYK